LSAVG